MRISLHLRKIQFRILLEKKKEEKYHSISLILLARSNAVYSNIKFPIVLSINCNLPKEKKKTNSSRKGKSLRYSNEGKKKNKVNAKLNGGRARRRRGRRRGRREKRDERSKFLSARNRIREWFMGLHRGRIHRGPPGIFLYSYALSLVFFAPRISSPPPPLPLSLLRLGMGAHAVCAEFESPCNKIRALCDGRVTPRIYLRKGEMYTGRGTYIPSRVR